MLVIHWARHNKTDAILKNGIRPASRKHRKNQKGVYAYPYSRLKTMTGNWRRNLKTWDGHLGNYNGFVFRLTQDDFPLIAGSWELNRTEPMEYVVKSLQEFGALMKNFFTQNERDFEEEWGDFEIIIPRLILPKRIIKVLRDRQPLR